jgi:hypothetical protein
VLFSQARKPGKQTFRFTAAGVADGRYEIVLSATDGLATVTTSIPVFVDRTVHGFTGTPAAVSPNGDGTSDALTFGFELTRAASVRLEIAQAGKTLVPVYAADLQVGVESVAWTPTGLKDGKYAAVLTATNDVGTVVHTVPFRIDTVAPTLRALSFRNLRFRVSEPATIRLVCGVFASSPATLRATSAGRCGSRSPGVVIALELQENRGEQVCAVDRFAEHHAQ